MSPRETSSSNDGPDENTPLLAAEPLPTTEPIETAPKVPEPEGSDEDAPLPLAQILLLCYTRVVEPIAFFSIFPYINSMIEKVGGVDKEDVGFYSGLIESLFSLTQMCVMILWGKVLVFSLVPPTWKINRHRLRIAMAESRVS